MLPIDTEAFALIYPIKFTAPLSLVECKNRLQQSLGKAMGSLFTTIEGEVEMVDDTTCKFRLYQVFLRVAGVLLWVTYMPKPLQVPKLMLCLE